jgi:hypothetical protein
MVINAAIILQPHTVNHSGFCSGQLNPVGTLRFANPPECGLTLDLEIIRQKKTCKVDTFFVSALQAFSFVMLRATQALGSKEKSLAMPYFHMGKPHTIIGAEQFHF